MDSITILLLVIYLVEKLEIYSYNILPRIKVLLDYSANITYTNIYSIILILVAIGFLLTIPNLREY